ncbi:transcriptional regulator [Anaerobacillus alkalilacustris]|uniref:Transcriptional regulator n=1 Tax=Anaerobacillus alkalilacustris TaxID=393763 RepID=A0A1S2LJK2_9BACI|nr:helix-turn-helix transcriptional regulator [Anaerobacillus alkalilacustris]OIJ12692.1 transcriptional regulator [Anaerobacillus alkalilacustris]
MNLGALLRAARERNGLSQEELALKLHRSRSCISKFENNKKQMDVQTFIEWMNTTSAKDIMIAALSGVDQSIVMKSLEVISQLLTG